MTPDAPQDRSGWHVLCLGLGYTAAALARRLAPQGARISGTARSDDGVDAITDNGWSGIRFDGGDIPPALEAAIADATHILISAAPDNHGDPILRSLGVQIATSSSVEWIGYLSTVSVYGDYGGAWVDETTTPRDPGIRGQMRLDAEQAWLQHGERSGKRVDIFRLPGIYGPGRSAVDQLRHGTARRISKPGQVFNRIHVDDIATALEAAMATASAHRIYNITDDEPSPADEVVAYAAQLLGIQPPPLIPFEEAAFTPMARSFYDQTKRVSNKRMKESLGVKLAYPTYREGIRAIAAANAKRTS